MALARSFWLVLWLYTYGILAHSIDIRSTVSNEVQYYDVATLQFMPRQPSLVRSKKWHIKVEVREVSYLFDLEEVGEYRDELIEVLSTKGTAYILAGGRPVQCGSARFVISEPHSIDGRSLRGSFEDGKTKWHLKDTPRYQIWSENDLEPTQEQTSSALDFVTESLLIRRDGDEMDNDRFRNNWPTTQDLTEALSNSSDSQCFAGPVVARVGIAADYNFMQGFSSPVDARLHIADMVNKASEIWEQAFNVSLLLKELITVQNSNNNSYSWNIPCDNNVNTIASMNTRLQALTNWRQRERDGDGLATWSLLTDCPSGDVVGLAWQATVCESSGVNIVRHNMLDYKVLAHEIGHNFGAVHDCVNTTCGSSTVCCPQSTSSCDSRGAFIMSPGTSESQSQFSLCTRSNVCSGIINGEVNTQCLIGKSGTSDPPVWESQCASQLDPNKVSQCVRNAQCSQYMNTNSSYYCGNSDDCRLTCFDPASQQCKATKLALLDGTPCGTQRPNQRNDGNSGFCNNGSCGLNTGYRRRRRNENWVWIALAVGVSAAVFITVLGVCLIFKRFRNQRLQEQAIRPDPSKLRAAQGSFRSTTKPKLPPILPFKG